MLKHYGRVLFRSIQSNVGFTLINTVGLSIGLASTILILLWVDDELSFNKSFSNYNSIYLVKQNIAADNGITTGSLSPYPLKDYILQDSRAKHMAITVGQSALLSTGDKKLRKSGLDASEAFLEMFDFPVLHGKRKGALDDLMSIVLTQSTAIALFGTDDVVGRSVTVKIENDEELKVSAVIADPPANCSFNPGFILPFKYFERTAVWLQYAQQNWTNNSFNIYVQLQEGVSQAEVDNSIRNLIREKSNGGSNGELFLHPMSRWRLHNEFSNGKESGGLIKYVVMFSIIGMLTLVMACLNFLNLTTAKSQVRAREIAVRKSVGSSRKELVFQFMSESLFLSGISLFVAIGLVETALPAYNVLINKSLALPYSTWQFWMLIIGLIAVTGLLAGTYPALYLSSLKPAKILKGNTSPEQSNNSTRKIFVIIQNSFSILLIIGTAVVYLQIIHLKDREPGYNRENLLLMWSNTDIEKNYRSIKEELLSTGAALAVTKSNSPVTRIFASSKIEWPGMPVGSHLEATNIATEYDYTKTLGIKILEGRDFSPEFRSDTSAILINRAAAEAMALKEPVGQQLEMWSQRWTIIGVMDNVIMGSGAREIQPLVMTMDPTWSTTITLRIPKAGNISTSLKAIEDVLRKYAPDYPFEYRFADAEFDEKFSTINMTGKLAGIFALLTILITALGLLGIAAFTAQQRTKEIGIRKVLGASVSMVLLLLTKDFAKIVLIAFALTVPFAWWITSDFLAQYEIRISMPFWVYPVALLICLAITSFVAITQAYRVAVENPVKSLRSE